LVIEWGLPAGRAMPSPSPLMVGAACTGFTHLAGDIVNHALSSRLSPASSGSAP
jgi:hypothetical protein